MTTSVSTLGRRAVAAAGIAAVGLLGLSPVAAAEDANYGNIKENATGSLTIHKHIQNDGTRGTVDGQGAVEGGQPVAGVQFTAYPIDDIDLKTAAGWTTVSALAQDGAIPDSACADPSAPALAGRNVNSGNPYRSGDTDPQGQATIAGLPVKAYLVCETKAPSDIVQKAKPFVVTIPYANTAPGEEGNWLYDVHAYPKNERIAVNKTIEDQRNNGYAVGSVVKFPVTSTLPALDASAYYKYFQFKDQMDARLSELAVPEVTLDGAPLVATSDYSVEISDQTVKVTFTADGLGKLKAAAGKEVKAIFQGKVTSAGDGTIKNTAQLISDTTYATTPPNPENPPLNPPSTPPTTPEVQTKWGDLTISKVDARDPAGSKAGLKGAEFQIYNAATPYAGSCDGATKTGDPLRVNGETTLTTNEQGVINIGALFVSDSIVDGNRDNQVGATQRCYVVVETKAPTGYVLPQQAETPVTIQVGQVTTDNITIENTKHAVPNLPLTGAAGKVLLTVAGAALLMVAIGSVLVSRYRERKRASL
ncbi:SpaH/EbpB family LPXTG-anchored major pilin [Actinomyces bowdenii]|uniref:Isopeptide-forming domain-containing fimbrial protein n=1 Tax=Actinomyces bowdenii TaxID=131109 RepID=A0A3P1VAF6_9ACTO|nr:SpaH/EbpB family LPXTG-anchored major pilin [Actinomyces bowdenii]RRD30738.1 isopeptide-forming domain-containing fimbrial protein [Actinomyces bowdenii]